MLHFNLFESFLVNLMLFLENFLHIFALDFLKNPEGYAQSFLSLEMLLPTHSLIDRRFARSIYRKRFSSKDCG